MHDAFCPLAGVHDMAGHVHCFDPRAQQIARAYGLAANALKNVNQKPEVVSAQLTADIGTAFSELPIQDRTLLLTSLNGEGPRKHVKERAISTGQFAIDSDIARDRSRLSGHISAMLKALPTLDAALIEERSRVGGYTP